jgi:hypothetical protein
VVPLILELVVGPVTPYDNLDLMDSAVTNVDIHIANIDITTNNSAGWELWITSTNSDNGDQALVNDDGDTIDYTLTYAGTNGLTATAVTTTTGTKYGEADNTDTATRYSESSTLNIQYSQGPSYPAGYYSDQLTIVLRAK